MLLVYVVTLAYLKMDIIMYLVTTLAYANDIKRRHWGFKEIQ